MKKSMLLLGFFMISLAINAQSIIPRSKQICLKQQKSINQGKRDGSLTVKEVRQLKNQKRDVKKTVRIARADGVVTSRERKIIAKKSNRLSRSIARKKNNPQVRF